MSSITVYTGLLHYQLLEQYNPVTGIATGIYKPNLPDDTDYVAPVVSDQCPLRATKWIGSGLVCETDDSVTWDSIIITFDDSITTFDRI